MNEFIASLGLHGLKIVIYCGIAFVFYYFGAAIVTKLVSRAVDATRKRHHLHPKDAEKRRNTLTALFRTMWRVLVIAVAAFGILSIFFSGAELAPLFASAGIVGVALGFGAQSLVKDFLSGIFIISENQYRVGDIIEIEGASGTVERIGARSTVIRDADGNVHYFPNGMVQHVINKTMGYSMARFSIGVLPTTDLDDVVEIINTTGKTLAEEEKWQRKIIEAPSFVSIGDFASNSVELFISGKTQPSDQWSVIAEMRRRLLEEFEEKKIKLSATVPAAAAKKK